MKKRLAAGALAAVSTASVLGVAGAAPAQAAAQPCGTYPAGLVYALQSAPGSAYVSKGAIVSLRATLRRGGEYCVGYSIALYAKRASEPTYRNKGANASGTTGSVRPQLIVDETTRYFFNVNLGGGSAVRSKISQFVVTNP